MKIPKEISKERERVVWSLRQKCWTQERIAEYLEISQSAVAKILLRLNQRYSKELNEDIERVKTEQLAQLEHIADEAMQAWERSKEAAKTVRVKKGLGRDNQDGEQTNEARDQDGDPRYLTVAMKAKEDIRKITGSDAPTKSEISGKDGKPIETESTIRIYIPSNDRD
jgi:predicted transcriptional regulator